MTTRRLIPAIVIAVFLAGLLWGGRARGMVTSFLIEGADQTRYETLTQSFTLNDLLDALGTHFVVDTADSLRHAPLTYPAELQPFLDALPRHFVLDTADANRFNALQFPLALIGDTTPPQEVGTPTIIPTGPGSVKITWQTDEFSRGSIAYGPQPGQYTGSVSEPLYARNHELVLSGLAAEGTYYYRISHTDPSGNQAQGVERSFSVGASAVTLFLPMIVDR